MGVWYRPKDSLKKSLYQTHEPAVTDSEPPTAAWWLATQWSRADALGWELAPPRPIPALQEQEHSQGLPRLERPLQQSWSQAPQRVSPTVERARAKSSSAQSDRARSVPWQRLQQKSLILQGPAIVGARLPPLPFSRFILRAKQSSYLKICSKTPQPAKANRGFRFGSPSSPRSVLESEAYFMLRDSIVKRNFFWRG